ncbi:DNA replication initiation factor cdc45 [Friedmanniomyces endolithicus]|nr:DNA replication initiation factor cdc45 [Friedmanniomyces endolithicus]KAK0969482.1 DNA replication initiation factor cdc45 [Friedmanniomyces endolithicus]KAK1049746.1 DNA replication initiation factor cdc45 [Friedmanniomyces endolithicus]
MYLPRPLLPHLYSTLLNTLTPSSSPLLLLTAPTVDAICALRILTAQLKRDFIPHKVRPVGGYAELQKAGDEEVKGMMKTAGGEGGVVVCLGCGGGVDVGEMLGLTSDGEDVDGEGVEGENAGHGVEVWVVDAHRGWNLENVFGGNVAARRGVEQGKLLSTYRPRAAGGVIVWDEGDIETDLQAEREAYFALQGMPEITEEDLVAAEDDEDDVEEGAAEIGDDDAVEPPSSQTRKRKASSQDSNADSDIDSADDRPARRRRSNSGLPIPSSPTSAQPPPSSQPDSPSAIVPSSPPARRITTQKQLRRQLLKLRRKHEATLEAYYDRGSWTGEPVSSILYSLVSELGREDNEVLWLAVVGAESVQLSHFTTVERARRSNSMTKLELLKAVLRDEVRRLNPPATARRRAGVASNDVPVSARSATDTSIRLSPEPRFALIRHWSLLDSMLHPPYLATRLHIWNEPGRKRLNKLLAKMGISLQEAGKGYLHLDLEVKRTLGRRVGKFAEQYGLEGLVPEESGGEGGRGWGFVRSWGWRGTLSAGDVVAIVSAILEVGPVTNALNGDLGRPDTSQPERSYNHRATALPSPPHSSDSGQNPDEANPATSSENLTTHRFFAAYDALSPTSTTSSHLHNPQHTHTQQGLPALLTHLPLAQHLSRAILRTGSALISKNQIRHLRSFRLEIVKEGPDLGVFVDPGALVKLGGWVGEAVGVLEGEKRGAGGKGGGKGGEGEGDGALVLGCLDEGRGVYVVVGLGSGGARGGRGVDGGKVRTKAEIKEREEGRKRKVAARLARKAERAREKEQQKLAKRERDAANGLLDSDDEEEAGSDATESDASSSSGSSGSSSDSSSDERADVSKGKRKGGAQRSLFALAFQAVVAETGARVRIDSFEHSVVEVRKEDLAGFLEGLSLRSLVG